MLNYIIRRLLLLPVTLFFIILVNFIIVNFAPGEPTSVTEISARGQAERQEKGAGASLEDRYLQFRERYGLTLPILFNLWPSLSQDYVQDTLEELGKKEESFKELQNLRIRLGDQSRFIMPKLLKAMTNPEESLAIRKSAMRFFVRGGTRQAFLGGDLSSEQQKENEDISEQNEFLRNQLPETSDSEKQTLEKIGQFEGLVQQK